MIRWSKRNKENPEAEFSKNQDVGNSSNLNVKRSYAIVLQSTKDGPKKGTVNFRFLESNVKLEGFDTCLPID